jgi:hypothetical protein
MIAQRQVERRDADGLLARHLAQPTGRCARGRGEAVACGSAGAGAGGEGGWNVTVCKVGDRLWDGTRTEGLGGRDGDVD